MTLEWALFSPDQYAFTKIETDVGAVLPVTIRVPSSLSLFNPLSLYEIEERAQ
jgi:hypothetical protein